MGNYIALYKITGLESSRDIPKLHLSERQGRMAGLGFDHLWWRKTRRFLFYLKWDKRCKFFYDNVAVATIFSMFASSYDSNFSLCPKKSQIRIPCLPGLQSNTSLECALNLVLILLCSYLIAPRNRLFFFPSSETKAIICQPNAFLIEFHCIPSNPLPQICFQFLIMMEFKLYLQEKGLM